MLFSGVVFSTNILTVCGFKKKKTFIHTSTHTCKIIWFDFQFNKYIFQKNIFFIAIRVKTSIVTAGESHTHTHAYGK